MSSRDQLTDRFIEIPKYHIIAIIKFSLNRSEYILSKYCLKKYCKEYYLIIARFDDKCVGRSIKSVIRRLEICRPVDHNRLVDHPCCLELRRVKRGTRLHHFARLSSEWTRVPRWYTRPDCTVLVRPPRLSGVIEIRTIGYGGALPERTKWKSGPADKATRGFERIVKRWRVGRGWF